MGKVFLKFELRLKYEQFNFKIKLMFWDLDIQKLVFEELKRFGLEDYCITKHFRQEELNNWESISLAHQTID